MANWKYKLNVSDFYHDDNLSIEEKGQRMVAAIKETFPLDYELCDVIESFDVVDDVEEFDNIMSSFYDWCDQEVAPFGKWPANKMCWVKT